jgi:hypothetical protein
LVRFRVQETRPNLDRGLNCRLAWEREEDEMAALEYRILTKILETGNLQEAIHLGLKKDHFAGSEAKGIWAYINQYWHSPLTNHTLPSVGKVRTRWPSFMPTANTLDEYETLDGLIKGLKVSKFENDARGLAQAFQELVEEDPDNAMNIMLERMRDLEMQRQGKEERYTGLTEIASLSKEQYAGAKTGAIYGIPWPWKCLTEDTLGKRDGDFIILYGRMKSLKTWIALYCAVYDFMVNNCRVLFWSREMSERKLAMRTGSILANVDYQMFKSGILPPRMEQQANKIFDDILSRNAAKEDMRHGAERGVRDLLLLCGRDAPTKLDGLKNWVDRFRPSVIYMDSFYHMDSERSENLSERWKRVAALAEDIKGYAEDIGLPIVAVHQANRMGDKTYGNTLADMADADVIAREADLIIRCLKKPGTGQGLHEDDYEVEYDKIKRAPRRVKPRPVYDGRPKLDLRPGDPVLSMDWLAKRLEEREGTPRAYADIAMVLGGNREGVLNAFTLRVIPGYKFELLDDRPSMKEISKWVKEDDKSEDDAKPAKSNVQTQPSAYMEQISNAIRPSVKK